MFGGKNRVMIGILMAVLIGLCIASNIFLLVIYASGKIMPKIGAVLNLIALVSATVYCSHGYHKEESIFYKGFFFFYALHLLIGTFSMVMDFGNSMTAAVWMLAFEITFANTLLLFVPDNLGKKKSKIIADIDVIIWIICLIYQFAFRSDSAEMYALRIASYLLTAVLAAVLIHAKYADKTRRHAGGI